MKKLLGLFVFALLFTSCVPYKGEPPNTMLIQTTEAIADKPVSALEAIEYPRELMFYEVCLEFKTDPITTGTSWIDYEIINYTDEEFFYGEDFLLLKKTMSGWEYADMLPDAGWNEIGIILTPDSVNGGSIDIGYFYGELEEGEYRLEKDLFSEEGGYILTAEFEVANAAK